MTNNKIVGQQKENLMSILNNNLDRCEEKPTQTRHPKGFLSIHEIK